MQRLDDVGNPDAPYGTRERCAAMRVQVQANINDTKSRVSHLKFDLKSMRDEAQFATLQDKEGADFATWEDFCQYPRPWGLGFSAEVANALITERNGDKLVSAVAAEIMANAPTLRAKPGRPVNGSETTNIGRGADYLAARIKRDHPEIAESVERGEFRSIRAAAKAAGIVTEKEPLEHLCRWWRKTPPEQQAQFRDFIDTPVMDRRFS